MFYLIGLGIDAILLVCLIISYRNKKRNEDCICDNCKYLTRKYKVGRSYNYECKKAVWTFDKDRYPITCADYKDKNNANQKEPEEHKIAVNQVSKNYSSEIALLNSQTLNHLAYQANLESLRTQLNTINQTIGRM